MTTSKVTVQLALALLVLLASLAPVPVAAQAKTCWRISHGTLCYVNGRYYSIRCQHGYRVDPPGSGHSCVAVRGNR